MPKNVPDLDAALDFDPDEVVPTMTVRMFGREWNLNSSVNVFNVASFMASFDATTIHAYIKGLVAEDQWDEFSVELSKVKNLDLEKLMKIINAMTEAIAERPTTPPSGSRSGPTKRTSSPRSAASTRAKRASASRR